MHVPVHARARAHAHAHAHGLTGRLANLSSRRPRTMVLIWIALFLVGGVIAGGFPADLTTDIRMTQNPESYRADDLLASRFQGEPSPDEFVIVSSGSMSVDAPEFRAFVDTLVADIGGMSDYVAMVVNPYEAGNPALVADDRTATIVPVFIRDLDLDSHPFLRLIDEHSGKQGFTVVTGGEASITTAFNETSESDLLTGEIVGISVAMLVLVVVFGTLVAAGVPLALAILAITISLGITALVGRVFELSIFVINMMVMIGLAVGIDYSLFIIGRYREERRKGIGTLAALTRTGDTANKAVLFSGLTVVTALLGMLIVPSSLFKSLGAGAIFVVVVSVLATLTLLPAALSLIDNGIERGRGRTLMGFLGVFLLGFAAVFNAIGVGRFFIVAYVVLAVVSFVLAVVKVDPFHRRDTTREGGFWDRLTQFVMRRPVPLVTLTTAALVAVGLVYFTINIGQSGISTLPADTDARRAFTLLEEKFSAISLEAPNVIVVDGDAGAPDVQAAVERLKSAVAADPAYGPVNQAVNAAGDLVVLSVPATDDTQSTAALRSIERLRETYIPRAFAGVNTDVLVGGPSAESVDFNHTVDQYTPIVFAFVLSVSFLLLLLAFRSLVVPLKSVLMNLLSVGASYGLLVLVFQHGVGNELFGFQQVERIDAWVPLMMFSILFGLSMDYHVFLLSRIRERYDLTRDNIESVAHGLRTTASMITGAALIMVAVFGGFAMGELSMFQQMGFGLATAVLLDATIIRSVLVPATMRLLGDLNWYFPRWLDWLPRVDVEGIPEIADAELAPEVAVAD